MADSNSRGKSKRADIRAEFDKILMHHVSSLIDTREDIAARLFNLPTLTCLLLLVERENEIKSFINFPPDRYNRDAFFSDIEETGLDLDEDVMAAIQNLEHYGFVIVNDKKQYIARESASHLIIVLDSIFPRMPGMSLVAYVIQAIEEVIKGRKEQHRALRDFDQSLSKQGVRFPVQQNTKISISSTNRVSIPPQSPEVLLKRRSAYLKKLKSLRNKRLVTDVAPSIVTGHTQIKHAKITELFPKKAPKPEAESEAAFLETTPPDAGLDMPVDTPAQRFEPPAIAETQPLQVTEAPSDDAAALPEVVDSTHVDALPSETESSSKAEFLEDVFDELEADSQGALSKEALIEQKIPQFEAELAMPCPVCGIGKVLSDTTEKGKTYYHCSNEDCQLISWGKPYHMECPICRNPFLIEVPQPDGEIGLKCPRATCLYRKKKRFGRAVGRKNRCRKEEGGGGEKEAKKGVPRMVRKKS